MYSFSYLEPVCCSMFSFNCCFLTCIQISQEAPLPLRRTQQSPERPCQLHSEDDFLLCCPGVNCKQIQSCPGLKECLRSRGAINTPSFKTTHRATQQQTSEVVPERIYWVLTSNAPSEITLFPLKIGKLKQIQECSKAL